ncbi:nucleolar protein [Tilletia horrida]|uniref:Nucleolar protein n=1 Tax=Tilletia horrida TaxID=155126 RepID=A0AAN6GV63_9BASI|nr:nucleolar protein [Tilletia horrida]KAK0551504.1 nucleolar protein [Tilletia horrida]KAK0566497.1 nucleolar protein [Tilletia horrida]
MAKATAAKAAPTKSGSKSAAKASKPLGKAPAAAPAAKPSSKPAPLKKAKSSKPAVQQHYEDQGDEDDDEEEGESEEAASKQSATPIDVKKLPSSKDDAAVKARLDKVQSSKKANKTKEVPGVLYIGRLPHGFHEEQLRSYFSQFGTVTRLRLSRNRATGAPKHYGFLEFADRDVAAIVRETMDNYLLDGHLIQVKEVPEEEVHERLWAGSNRKFRPVPQDRLQRLRHDAPKTDEQKAKVEAKLVKREKQRKRKLEAAGIEYEYEGYQKV